MKIVEIKHKKGKTMDTQIDKEAEKKREEFDQNLNRMEAARRNIECMTKLFGVLRNTKGIEIIEIIDVNMKVLKNINA